MPLMIMTSLMPVTHGVPSVGPVGAACSTPSLSPFSVATSPSWLTSGGVCSGCAFLIIPASITLSVLEVDAMLKYKTQDAGLVKGKEDTTYATGKSKSPANFLSTSSDFFAECLSFCALLFLCSLWKALITCLHSCPGSEYSSGAFPCSLRAH